MRAEVFHADKLVLELSNDAVFRAVKLRGMDGYTHVASVQIPDTEESPLDFVFQKTNHIDSNWTLNREVAKMVEQPRSTSVGDLVKLRGRFFVCMPVGRFVQ